jgi:hypothetical protein
MYLTMAAWLTDDPDATAPPPAAEQMIRTRPAPIELNHYVFDRDIAVRMTAATLQTALLRRLYPRETA